MVNIYCLLNPDTGDPFYVGASKKREKDLVTRHITTAKNENGRLDSRANPLCRKRCSLIKEWVRNQKVFSVLIIETVPALEARRKEKHYYARLTALGYDLLQDNSKFHYVNERKK